MKKFIFSILVSLLLLMPTSVFAAGYISPSTTSLSVQQGSSTSFKITAFNAIGDVSIFSSNSGIASVSPGSWSTGMVGDGQTLSGTITVTGVSVGTTQIVLNIDGANFEGSSVSRTVTINVTVTAKPAASTTPSTGGGGSTYRPPVVVDNRSKNSNLSKLTINGKEITRTDNSYVYEVSNYISSVEINGVCEDGKASLSGIGKKDLNVGDNSFDVVVTAENGSSTTYKVVIKRSEFNVLSDLDELLKLDSDGEIKLTDTDKLDTTILDKIIKSKKKIILNAISSENVKLYSWILDGSLIKSVSSFNPIISNVIESNDKMEEALNYADGIYLDFSKCGDIPKGAILKYNVSSKYKDKDKINLYAYSEKSKDVQQLEEGVKVKDGSVELKITQSVKHFMSKARMIEESSDDGFNIWLIVSIVLFIIVIACGVYIVLMKKNTDNKNSDNKTDKRIATDIVDSSKTGVATSKEKKKSEEII